MNLDIITPGERYMVCGGVGGTPETQWLAPPDKVGIIEVTRVGRQPGRTTRTVDGTVVQALDPPAARGGTLCMQDLSADVTVRGNHLLAGEHDYRQIWAAQQAALRAYTAQLPHLRRVGQRMAQVAEAAVGCKVEAIVPDRPERPDHLGVIAVMLITDDLERVARAARVIAPCVVPSGNAPHPQQASLFSLGWRKCETAWQFPASYVSALRRECEDALRASE